MNFTPLNIRMTIPQVNDVGQVQHNLNQQGALAHNFATNKDREQQEVLQTQVQKKDNAENDRIKDDPDREKKQGKGKSKHRSPEERHRQLLGQLEDDEDEEIAIAVDQHRGRLIDISG